MEWDNDIECHSFHPHPQLRRESWVDLSGIWDFTVQTERSLPRCYDREIRIPFCPESRLSGIGMHFPDGSYLFYRKRFSILTVPTGKLALLHIGAADQELACFVNGTKIGCHSGGYTSCTLELFNLQQGYNEIILRVTDDLRDVTFPRGKQSRTPGGMWYTPVSGIWQRVWLEWVPEQYIQKLDFTVSTTEVSIDVCNSELTGTVQIKTPFGMEDLPLNNGVATFCPGSPRLWTPEDPYLYSIRICAGADCVFSYFGMRALSIQTVRGIPRLCLNGKPYFFHGLLDQGYHADGIYTPDSDDRFREEILTVKKLGFTTLRKHIKIEPEEFYYQCDRLGMLVFQDMVNNGKYSYVKDTILPTLGFQRKSDKMLHNDPHCRQRFLLAMEETVEQLKNHPCIVLWTIFNEGWGQFDATSVYQRLKQADSSRFICTCSGWFRGGESDVFSRHIYFGQWNHLKQTGMPLVLSEFGGICLAVEGHLFQRGKSYGYQSSHSFAEYQQKLCKLYRKHIIPAVKRGLCAAIYTQVSDVEDEINGFLTYDRQVIKPNAEQMQEIATELRIAMAESCGIPENQ